MRRFLKWMAFLILLPFILIQGYCHFAYPTYRWHQKLVVEVENEGQIYRGESVTAVRWIKRVDFPPDAPDWITRSAGEAVVVELPGPRYLFVLLSGAKNSQLNGWLALFTVPMNSDLSNYIGVYKRDAIRKVLASKGQAFSVERYDYPLFVTFDDINKPATVKRVDPNDLDTSFGCSKPSAEAKPWRAKGQVWLDWFKENELKRLSRERARDEAGISSGAAAILSEYSALYVIRWSDVSLPADQLKRFRKLNMKIRMRDGVTKEEESRWEKTLRRLEAEMINTGRDTRKDCYKLKSITLEITDGPVTEGKVEAVLGWFYDVNRVVPKEYLEEYRRKYGRSVPGKGDFISYKSWRRK